LRNLARSAEASGRELYCWSSRSPTSIRKISSRTGGGSRRPTQSRETRAWPSLYPMATSTPKSRDYQSPTTQPGELLDPRSTPDRTAIEEHLLDGLIPAVYRARPP
jgi:hypothetical protein